MHEWVKIGVEYGVLGFLGFLSFVTISIGIERWLSYKETDIEKFDNRHDLEAHLTKNLTLLSTIASNAVYIGLLGTVLGILDENLKCLDDVRRIHRYAIFANKSAEFVIVKHSDNI